MPRIALLKSRSGDCAEIAFDPGTLESLLLQKATDAYIVATEDGFSPLGINLKCISSELGIPEKEIKELATWNRFENSNVTLVALPTRRKNSSLRGAILAASETSECYKRFATPIHGRPHRDFYYNVTYEAIAHATGAWGARRIAISHLSASQRFHEDIAICNAEALAHYFDTHSAGLDSLTFLGCCIEHQHLAGISRLNVERPTGQHRAISTQVVEHNGYTLVHLQWSGGA